MTKDNNILARESFWGSIVTYLGVSLGFVTTFFVLTQYLSPAEIGLTRLLVEISTLLSGLGLLGMSTSISRYYPYFKSESAYEGIPDRGFFAWTMRIASVGLLATLGLYLLLSDILLPLLSQDAELLKEHHIAVLPLTVFITLWTIVELYAIQLMHLAIPRIIRELILRLLLLFCYLAYAFDWLNLTGLIASFVASYGLCMMLCILYLSRIRKLRLKTLNNFPSEMLRKSFVRYTFFAVLSVVGTMLAGRMDLIMLAIHPEGQGLTSAGVYTIGFFMVSIIEIPTRAIIGLATARFALLMKEKKKAEIQTLLEQVNRYQLLSSMLIYLAIYASIDSILTLMPSAEQYTGVADVFLILGLAKLVEVSFTSSHPIVNNSPYYHYSLYYTLWTVCAAFLANYYLIPLWDVQGAAVATALTNIVGYAFLQIVVIGKMKFNPCSWRMLRVVLMGGIVFVLLPYLPHYNQALINIIVSSSCSLTLALGLIWVLKLAPEAESQLIKSLRRLSQS